MAQELDNAVLCLFDPACNPDIRTQAEAFCKQIQADANFFGIAAERLRATSHANVRFWCLQALFQAVSSKDEYLSVPQDKRNEVKGTLLTWWHSVLAERSEASFILNKYAQVIVALCRAEYPHEWPGFFSDLLSLLALGERSVDLFLRIMATLDEELLSHELQGDDALRADASRVKDAMRVGPISDVVSALFGAVVHFQTSNSSLSAQSLSVLKRYVEWIDIGLVVNDHFVPLLFKLLSESVELRGPAAGCLGEILSKKMTPVGKYDLLVRIGVLEAISRIVPAEEDVDFALSMVKLVAGIARELHGIFSQLRATATSSADDAGTAERVYNLLVEHCIPILFTYAAFAYDEVSEVAFESISEYVTLIKRVGVSPTAERHLRETLLIVRNKMKFDSDYNFDRESEEEAEFLQFRKLLTVIVKNISRVVPDLTKAFVAESLNSALLALPSTPFADLEVALSLFYHLGEGVGPVSTKPEHQVFADLVVAILDKNVAAHSHRAVVLLVHEIIVRYGKFLASQPAYISPALAGLLDKRGLRHMSPAVRSRCAYLFLRLVRTLRSHMHAFVDTVLQSLSDMLSFDSLRSTENLAFADQLHVFEGIGVIIVSERVPADRRLAILTSILNPLTEGMAGVLNADVREGDNMGTQSVVDFLLQLVNVIGYVSKGLPEPCNDPGIRALLLRSLDAVAAVVTRLYGNEHVRNQTLFFLHRMVACLEADALPCLQSPLCVLCPVLDLEELDRIYVLVNQIITKTEANAVPILHAVLPCLYTRTFQFLPSRAAMYKSAQTANVPISEDRREVLELHQNFFGHIQTLAGSAAAKVFGSSDMINAIPEIIGRLADGIRDVPDAGIQRTGVQASCNIMKKAIDTLPADTSAHVGKLVLDTIVPSLFEILAGGKIDPDDAQSVQLLGEVGRFHKEALAKFGESYAQYLGEMMQTRLGAANDVAVAFLSHVRADDATTLRNFLRSLCKQSR